MVSAAELKRGEADNETRRGERTGELKSVTPAKVRVKTKKV